jgi:predicted ATPase
MPQKKKNSKQTEVSTERNGGKSQNAYFLSLELKNIRCFSETQRIDFSDGNNNPRRWTIILGDNGTGKTTLLQTLIAVAPVRKMQEDGKERIEGRHKSFFQNVKYHSSLSGRLTSINKVKDMLEALKKDDFYKTFAKDGYNAYLDISCQNSIFQEQHKNIVGIHQSGAKMSEEGSISFYGNTLKEKLPNILKKTAHFAYGASRKVGETSLSEQNEESDYVTLFDETALLVNPEEWLLQSDYASKRTPLFAERNRQLEMVIEILIKILPDVDDIRFSEKEQENKRIPKPIVEFHTPYGWVESKDLSLGYRTSMAWMVDFASRMFDLYPESENPLAEPAVVLIDEIDLHLHPKWQRELIDYLTNLFPNTQFIVTTHSPLIVQAAAARDANIVVCRREGDHVVIDQSIEAVKNWRSDQILTSELFDLPTARPKKIEPFLEERQEILSKPKLTKKDEKRLQELEEKIGFMPVSEDNPEDDKAMDIIRRAAERLQSQAE